MVESFLFSSQPFFLYPFGDLFAISGAHHWTWDCCVIISRIVLEVFEAGRGQQFEVKIEVEWGVVKYVRWGFFDVRHLAGNTNTHKRQWGEEQNIISDICWLERFVGRFLLVFSFWFFLWLGTLRKDCQEQIQVEHRERGVWFEWRVPLLNVPSTGSPSTSAHRNVVDAVLMGLIPVPPRAAALQFVMLPVDVQPQNHHRPPSPRHPPIPFSHPRKWLRRFMMRSRDSTGRSNCQLWPLRGCRIQNRVVRKWVQIAQGAQIRHQQWRIQIRLSSHSNKYNWYVVACWRSKKRSSVSSMISFWRQNWLSSMMSLWNSHMTRFRDATKRLQATSPKTQP